MNGKFRYLQIEKKGDFYPPSDYRDLGGRFPRNSTIAKALGLAIAPLLLGGVIKGLYSHHKKKKRNPYYNKSLSGEIGSETIKNLPYYLTPVTGGTVPLAYMVYRMWKDKSPYETSFLKSFGKHLIAAAPWALGGGLGLALSAAYLMDNLRKSQVADI